jgi:hypothetical protein
MCLSGANGHKNQLLLYNEIIAVCSEIHTKHINTLCGQNAELLNVKPAGTNVTTGPVASPDRFCSVERLEGKSNVVLPHARKSRGRSGRTGTLMLNLI